MMGVRTLELAQAAQVPAVREKKNRIHFSELSISENQLGNPLASFVNRASPGTTPSIGLIVLEPRVLSDGGVPGEAQFAKEARLLSCFQQSCVAMNVYAGRYKRLNWKILKQTATLRRFHGED